MTWEEQLDRTAGEMGKTLAVTHLAPKSTRRVRWSVPAAAAILVGALLVGRLGAADPGESIAVEYRDVQKLERRIKPGDWDPAARQAFQEALVHIDKAIDLARDAVRRSPENPAFRELCHLAYRSKVRLFEAYLASYGG